ncbi:MAG TPA: gephyrin-like molybdotransferase Glp [Candidatus Acidoferrales bacterium]|jgi:molybdopterin molybdotransferase|nr:gephyrin-like molybdotransferase Glp [Candidatus Acidoferrales bacterium]
MLSFTEARQRVIEVVKGLAQMPARETVDLAAAQGRVLAEQIVADRDSPPFDRATRDGYAARAADLRAAGAKLALTGEIRAGQEYAGAVGAGQCVQIMTGAAVPPGADAVVMIEYTRAEKDGAQTQIIFERAANAGQNIVPHGSEARKGATLLEPGARLSCAELSLAAHTGHPKLAVWARPRIGILSTGDEIVGPAETPGPLQIRNGNSVSLAAQVTSAGGEPVLLGNARDEVDDLLSHISDGLRCDALVISGGVSAGKYDLVEGVLSDLGAQFYFDGVAIRPGRPAVFCQCAGKPVFGLPGNPISTMVTFDLFVQPAVDILGGAEPRPLPILRAKLDAPLDEKPDLAHFLPARIAWTDGEPVVHALPWHGSGDVAALTHSNCFIVVHREKLKWQAGEWIDVLPRRGKL